MDLVWLHRPLIFNKYFDYIRKSNQKVKIIFDMVDFHYIRMKREADLKNDRKLLIEANKFLEIETNNCKRADEIIVISETDKQSMLPYFKEVEKMKVISNIHDFIQNNPGFSSFEKRKDLLFVGSFEHQPNVDAVYFLKNDIMPLVWKKHPEIKVMVIGSNPTPEIENLTTESFQVLGYVEDLASYFNTTKLFVAPLRYGAGIKGKIGQSLEYGLPLVTTDIGAEGFDFGAFSNECIALNPEDFATKISSSYSDEKLWNAISKNSEAVLKPFSLAITEKSILSLFD
jgi:glycosyltransferase involved in cell wall biosynthesis